MFEKIKEMKQKACNFINEHGEEIITVCGIAGVAVAGYLAVRNLSGTKAEPESPFDRRWRNVKDHNSMIDEDIFTNIAPQIEDVLFEEGLDEGYINTTYSIVFPKGGDYENGTYSVKKNLEIFIRDMCDQEAE